MRVFFVILGILFTFLPAYSYDRVVSLSPAITEIIYYVGAGDKLIGVTVFCDHPEDVRKKIKVGGIVNPDLEKIYSLHPDLVIASNLTPEKVLKKLKSLGIKVRVLRFVSLEDVKNAIKVIGDLLSGNGEEKKKEFEIALKHEAKKLSLCLDKKKLLVIISYQPLYVAGSKSFIGEAFSLSGANVIPDVSFGVVSNEFVVINKPDLVILSLKGEKLKGAREFLKKFSIKSVSVTPDNLFHPGPRILIGLREVEDKVCRK